jgi:GxxExxY protein
MTHKENYIHSDMTNQILKAYYKVYNELGYGLTKEDYINALEYELQQSGGQFEINKKINLLYSNQIIGRFEVDLICPEKVIVQVTTNSVLKQDDLDKLPTLMKHSRTQVGLLLNFGLNPEHKRRVLN